LRPPSRQKNTKSVMPVINVDVAIVVRKAKALRKKTQSWALRDAAAS